MAKNKSKKKDKKNEKQGSNLLLNVPLMFGVLATAYFLKSTFLLTLIGLLPTVVAFYADRTEGRVVFYAMLLCNLAGIMPFTAEAIAHGNASEHVWPMMQNMRMWFAIYMAAGIGLMLAKGFPIVLEQVSELRNTTKIMRLQKMQERLIEEWGPEIQRSN